MIFHFKAKVQRQWSMKNNNVIRRAGSRLFVGKQQSLINDRDWLILQLKQAWQNEPISTPVHVTYKFYFKDFYTKKNQMNLKLGDLDNLLALPNDCLQKAGVIKDDALIMSFDGTRKLPGDENILEIILQNYKD